VKLAIALGASLGDRRLAVETALRSLAAKPGMALLRVSRWYRTPPLAGGTARNWFVNGVAVFETERDPGEVLDLCVALEVRAGRRRARHWGDRPLDLDLLLADGVVRSSGRLTLPHPGIARRPFVLVPLLEVWPDATDPTTGVRYASLPRPGGPRPVPIGAWSRRAPLGFL
jgi:2-amino-4-hydroxy-6-hydroxymethyldihydropteridine diphosphokinase